MTEQREVFTDNAYGRMDEDACASDTAQIGSLGSVDTVDPADDPDETDGVEIPIPTVIEQLHSGRLDPAHLPTELRRRCVGHLTFEGFTTIEIAQLMRICERTVRRDRAAVRRDDVLAPDRRLGDQLLGELERICMSSIQRLTRLANDPNNPPYARMWSEEAIVRIHQRFIDTAHRLNYFEDGKARLEDATPGISTQDPDFEEKMLAVLRKLGEE